MGRLKKLILVLPGFCIIFVLSACDRISFGFAKESESESITVESISESALEERAQRANYIYITTDGINFIRYLAESEDADAMQILDVLDEMTGWGIGVASVTTSSRGGLQVEISSDSCILKNAEKIGNTEFSISGKEMIVAAVLGSIQKTMQYYMHPDAADAVSVYFSDEDGDSLKIEGVLDLPAGQAYSYENWHEKE